MNSKVWEVMNDLEMVTSKIVSAREILDCAVDRLQEHQYDRTETLITAAYEFLEYYLGEFDEKFKLAWQETVVKQNEPDPCMPPWGHSDLEYASKYSGSTVRSCDKDDSSPECKGAWNSFWEENYYPEEYGLQYTDEEITTMCDAAEKKDKVKKWVLPVEETKIDETDETEYFITFPDDLLEAAKLKEGDEVYWVDNNDGTYTIRKKTKLLGMDEC